MKKNDMKCMEKKITDEFPCPRCEDGIAAIWLSPEVAQKLFKLEIPMWIYRCDRCGEKIAPGLFADDPEMNTQNVIEKKKRRLNKYK